MRTTRPAGNRAPPQHGGGGGGSRGGGGVMRTTRSPGNRAPPRHGGGGGGEMHTTRPAGQPPTATTQQRWVMRTIGPAGLPCSATVVGAVAAAGQGGQSVRRSVGPAV